MEMGKLGSMHWIYLILAIAFEVAGTLSIKQATLGNRYFWSGVIAVCYIISFTFIYYATKHIEIGIAYSIWAALGTALIVILGWLVFKESMNMMKIAGVVFIIFGVVLLKLQSTA
jgi:small multidrug resistance pump